MFDKFVCDNYVPDETEFDENGTPKHAMDVDKIALCCDVRGDRCVYMHRIKLSTEYFTVNRQFCMYKFKK